MQLPFRQVQPARCLEWHRFGYCRRTLGRYRLIEIVLKRFIVDDVVEIDQLNALLLNELQWKIAARVDDEIALSGHDVPFQIMLTAK